jgi:predicted double-glycine peptidase
MARHLFICLWLGLAITGCAELTVQGRPTVLHHTLKELRDQNVVKQQLDYSCGAAALATLMRYYFGEDTSEKEVLSRLQARLTREELLYKAQHGFSLLDLKQVALQKGYRAAGFRLTFVQLTRLAAPVIVFIEPEGYKHFAVLRGVDRGRVFLADPARGNLRMSIDRFLEEWQDIVFVLGKPGEEKIRTHPLTLEHPYYVEPELAHFNGQLDLGMSIRNLPLR